MHLAVEEIETWGGWKRRDEAMVRLHSAAITLGPLVVRSWRWYLSKTTSRAQIEAVLYPPVLRTQETWSMGRE